MIHEPKNDLPSSWSRDAVAALNNIGGVKRYKVEALATEFAQQRASWIVTRNDVQSAYSYITMEEYNASR